MKKQVTAIILLPLVTWFVLTGVGYGAQSLSNVIELPMVLFTSLVCLLGIKKINGWYIVLMLCVGVLLLRTFMPILPE